jgi:hypothetical protein
MISVPRSLLMVCILSEDISDFNQGPDNSDQDRPEALAIDVTQAVNYLDTIDLMALLGPIRIFGTNSARPSQTRLRPLAAMVLVL